MGFFARLKEGLHRTRVNLAGLFSGAVVDEDFFDELETSLIAADIGYEPTRLILQRLKDTVKLNGLKTPEEVRRALRDEIVRILLPAQKPLDVNRAKPFVTTQPSSLPPPTRSAPRPASSLPSGANATVSTS